MALHTNESLDSFSSAVDITWTPNSLRRFEIDAQARLRRSISTPSASVRRTISAGSGITLVDL